MSKFLVKPEHGRVYRRVNEYTRVLVALPGDEIDIELARECGLLDEPAPEPAEEEKSKKAEPAPKLQTYPTKTHKAV